MALRDGRNGVRLSALILPLLIAGAPAPAQDAALLSNAGFEEWNADGPIGWEAPGAEIEAEDADVHSEARALCIKAVRQGDHFRAELHHIEQVSVEAETLYLASIWGKGAGRLRIHIQQYSDTAWLGGRSSIHTDLTGEWTEYRFYYGAVAEGIRRVRFWVYVEGKDAVAMLDDASLRPIGPVRPLGPNLVANGDMEADADDDGIPDGWRLGHPPGAPDRYLTVGADASRALTCQCSLAPEDPGRRAAPVDWWDWAGQPPPAAGWINAASSAAFEVEPGRTYEIRFQLRGQGVRVYHTKLWWIDDEGNPIKWFTIGPRHDGDWDWEEATLSLTVPSAHVHAGRIEFWALAAGGRLWIDNVSVRPSRSYSVGWAAEEYEVRPLEAAALPPSAMATGHGERRGRTVSFKARPRSRVAVTDDAIRISLKSGVDLRLPLANGEILGVAEVRLGTLHLRNPAAPPIAPLVDTESGGHYVACRYVGHDAGEDGSVTIHTALISAEGHADDLDWIFQPVQREIEGRRYVGFAYRYELRTEEDEVNHIDDRATWELGGDPIGITVITQNAYNVANVFTVAPGNTYCGTGGPRFAGSDGLDYEFGPEGALAVFYDEPISHVKSLRLGSEEWIQYRDSVPFAGLQTPQTPLKCVLFGKQGNHDEWTRLRDHVYERHAAFWGIRQHTPMPIVNCWMHWRELAEHGDRILYDIADQAAPRLAELGFKVVAVHSVWGRGGCSLDVIEPGEKFGGTRALKYLCDKAAEHDMIVQAWAPTAHLWQYSPLIEQAPHWLIEGPDGQPPTTYCYPEIRGLRFRAGWADYAVEQWRKIREQTGLGSLWLDSYNSFTHNIRCADRRVYIEQTQDLFDFHARLSQLGYILYIESTGTFGIPAAGFPVANLDSPHPTGPDPMTRYGVSGYLGQRGNEKQDRAINDVITRGDYYYRCLANKAPCWLSWPTFSHTPDVHAKIGQANRDYNQVVRWMKYRRMLPDDRGVEWTNLEDRTRVLFSYRKGRYTCPGMTAAYDVTADQAVEVAGEGFMAEPSHTYRLTVPR